MSKHLLFDYDDQGNISALLGTVNNAVFEDSGYLRNISGRAKMPDNMFGGKVMDGTILFTDLAGTRPIAFYYPVPGT